MTKHLSLYRFAILLAVAGWYKDCHVSFSFSYLLQDGIRFKFLRECKKFRVIKRRYIKTFSAKLSILSSIFYEFRVGYGLF